jgi:hypothetical protein
MLVPLEAALERNWLDSNFSRVDRTRRFKQGRFTSGIVAAWDLIEANGWKQGFGAPATA